MARSAPIALFADDFDAPEAPTALAAATPEEPPPPPPPTYSQSELDEACAKARADGHERGMADAKLSQGAHIAATLAAIANGLAESSRALEQTLDEQAEVFAKLLLAAVIAGFPSLRERHGEAEFRAIIRRALTGLLQEQTVTFYVHPSLVPAIEAELSAVRPKEKQHMTIEPDESIPIGDGSIAWPNGRVVRDTKEIEQSMVEILAPLGLLPEKAASSNEQTG
jgi:flagellar assembly protein FliH